MHVNFIHILLIKFLMDSLVNIILFKLGHFSVHIETLSTRVRDGCWCIWVREGCRCLSRDGWLTDIYEGRPKIPIYIFHSPEKRVRGSWPKVEYITFYVGAPTLKFGLGFEFQTLGFCPSLLI